MNTFVVYREGQKDGVLVRAEACKEDYDKGNLVFRKGGETVAVFPLVEVQGWRKIDAELRHKLEAVACRYLEYNGRQRDLTYEMLVRELAPAIVDNNEQVIRDVLGHWNRHVFHFVPTLEGSTALCGRERSALDPKLDGRHSFLHTNYNCSQDEACPECLRLNSSID